MFEEWKDIKGYGGRYQISNLGNVRSLNWRRTGEIRLLSPILTTRGYLKVNLRRHGVMREHLIHRLVADAFIDGYEERDTVNHINENKLDNRVSNLEWCTIGENIAKYVGNHPRRCDGSPRRLTRPILQLTLEGDAIREFACVIEVSHELGYRSSSIKECCEGIRRTAYGYKWQYAI